jgi:hypothetical protein
MGRVGIRQGSFGFAEDIVKPPAVGRLKDELRFPAAWKV